VMCFNTQMSSSSRKKKTKKSKGGRRWEERAWFKAARREAARLLDWNAETANRTHGGDGAVCFSPVSLSLSLCVSRLRYWLWMDFLSLSLPNGPPSFKSVSFPSLSLSYSTRDIPPAIKVQRSGNSAHTHTRLLHRGGVICCGREPIGIRRSLSHFEPSDTAGPRPLSRTFFRQYIY
jgi:hypothetical protein